MKKIWYAPNKLEAYGEEEIKAVEQCLRDGWLAGFGPRSIEFEEKIAKESTIVLLPDSSNDVASLVAQSMAIIEKISNKDTKVSNVAPDNQVPPQPWKR